jgi:hypothetical protein
MSLATYHFTSSLRRGLATAITEPASGGRTQIYVRMTLHGKTVGGDPDTNKEITKQLEIYGPGDIVGFQPSAVVRTDPKPNVDDFEPNYFALVEFADPDFNWRFTADQAASDGRLTPWVTLIVLISRDKGTTVHEFDEGKSAEGLPRYISVLDPVESLPDFRESWRWAHVQAVGEEEDIDFPKLTQDDPERVLCRLMCARRLQPATRYSAFVVPTFELGRCAGLGITPTNGVDAHTPAWDPSSQAGDGLRLPYYYRWDFGTGERGDFERLVRLLEPRKEIQGLGTRPMVCSSPGYGVPAIEVQGAGPDEIHLLGLEGALQPDKPDVDVYTRWGWDSIPRDLDNNFRKTLESILNLNNKDITQGAYELPEVFDEAPIRDVELTPLPSVTSIEIKWITDRPMTSRIKFWQEGQEPEFISDLNLKTAHALTITGLEPGSLYHLTVSGEDDRPEFFETQDCTIRVPALPSVTPPIYGRWHAGENTVDRQAIGWLHELNLDPRHRTAAGFGSEVVKQQQEPLMADAWEQLADFEAANNQLRNAQMARESSNMLWRRLEALKEGAFLQLTVPVHPRVRLVEASPATESVYRTLRVKTQLPGASLSSAYRKISRPRGAIRRRQRQPWRKDVIQELAQGALRAAGPAPMPAGMVEMETITTMLASQTPLAPGRPTGPSSPSDPSGSPVSSAPDNFSRSSGLVIQYLKGSLLMQEIEAGVIADLNLDDPIGMGTVMGEAIDNWLYREQQPPVAPVPPADFVPNLKQTVAEALDPRYTMQQRVWARLRVYEDVQKQADPLDEIMWEPKFPQPMYEPLRALSQDMILPGVERVPQNTVLLLKTNRRFLESYMAGLNHEFAGELLWRGYPTDQRGSYFRQFWDVRDRVPTPNELQELDDSGDIEELQKKYLDIEQIHRWSGNRLGQNQLAGASPEQLVLVIRGDLLKKYPNTVIYAVDRVRLDIAVPAEGQPTVPALHEYLRYSGTGDPDDAINKFLEGEAPFSGEGPYVPVYPIFRGDLPPDLSFFGFPFDRTEVLGKYFIIEERIAETRFGLDMPGVTEPKILKSWADLAWDHFALPSDDAASGWHLNDRGPQLDAGDMTETDWWRNGNTPTPAQIAHITMQLPVRVAIDPALLLPER